jgi:hypothetical protein
MFKERMAGIDPRSSPEFVDLLFGPLEPDLT